MSMVGTCAVASWDSSPAAFNEPPRAPLLPRPVLFSVHSAFRTMTEFLLDNGKMASAFSACRNNTEHEATSEEPLAALAILPLCLLLLRPRENAASWRPCLRAA
ncbi:hypothetical protein MRX96_049962 [Rhipicephalus microplus]